MNLKEIQNDKLDDLYEVMLSAHAEAKRDGKVVFIAEVFYGVMVQVGPQVEKDKHHPLLMIEIPKFAFPYVRKIISDCIMDGGYPSMMMAPVDFHALYMSKFAAADALA